MLGEGILSFSPPLALLLREAGRVEAILIYSLVLNYMHQAILELVEICLPLPPEFRLSTLFMPPLPLW